MIKYFKKIVGVGRGCLKQDEINKYTHGTLINLSIGYKLNPTLNKFDPTLENCLFGAVKLTKTLILISKNIHDMVLDLIQRKIFMS